MGALAACATSIPDQEAGTATTTQSPSGTAAPRGDEVPVRPGKTDAGTAAGAPFRIPAFTELQGAPIVEVEELAVQRIAAACGGCASVAIAQDQADTGRSVCQYSGFSGAKQDSTPVDRIRPRSTGFDPGRAVGERVADPDVRLDTDASHRDTAPQKLPCGTEVFEPKTTSQTGSPTGTVSPTGTDSTIRNRTLTETATSKPHVTTTR
ncbi:hypothetical protein [Nocardia sp. NPDC047654]|uniref:hypothetical protein n=1 Tax=Nocardia sp. NPDC047654 TaxID=3364314 RepID=UPI003715A571